MGGWREDAQQSDHPHPSISLRASPNPPPLQGEVSYACPRHLLVSAPLAAARTPILSLMRGFGNFWEEWIYHEDTKAPRQSLPFTLSGGKVEFVPGALEDESAIGCAGGAGFGQFAAVH